MASLKYAKGLWVKRVSGLGLKKVRVMKGLMGLEGKGPNIAERSGFWARLRNSSSHNKETASFATYSRYGDII